MAQQERALRTRRVILEAAASVFDQYGYAAATIGEVIARAGVTRGALYFHFDSKQKLAEGVLEEQFKQEPLPARPCKLQELVDMSMVMAHRLPRDPLLSAGARLSLGHDAFDGTHCSSAIPGWIGRAETVLTAAGEQGELLPHIVPADTAWLLAASWTGAQIYSQKLTERSDLEQRIAALLEHLMPSIAVPGVLATLKIHPGRGADVAAELSTLRSAAPA
ncbi:ScbR family autoregulator-binding transcription factor [Kitasatospora sp. NPDC054939]